MKRWPACVSAFAFSCALHAQPEWLAVVSTDSSLERLIAKARQTPQLLGKVTVVASGDCRNLQPGLFLLVAGSAKDKNAAQQTVFEIRKTVPDAYLRACGPKPASRFQFGISAVDKSIFDVPRNAVNWDDKDRISEVYVAGAKHVWLLRHYRDEKNDSREGRRTSVLLFKTDPASAQKLTPDCADADVAAFDELLALTCAHETAGDQLLHQVQVFEIGSGKAISTVDRCRKPVIETGKTLVCEAEAVDASGQLKLTPKRLNLK